MNIFSPLKKMRNDADMVKMFPEFMCMEELFGLNEPAIIRILESVCTPSSQMVYPLPMLAHPLFKWVHPSFTGVHLLLQWVHSIKVSVPSM